MATKTAQVHKAQQSTYGNNGNDKSCDNNGGKGKGKSEGTTMAMAMRVAMVAAKAAGHHIWGKNLG
jgi:hypothetical protein